MANTVLKSCQRCKKLKSFVNEKHCDECRKRLSEIRQKTYLKNKDKVKQYIDSNIEKIRKRSREYQRNKDPLLKIWQAIKERCYNPKNPAFKDYGARGISMHRDWLDSFEKFREDLISSYTVGLSLDRYPDRNGHYEPGNVRWATWKEQANNRRSNIDYKMSIPDSSPIYYPFNNLIDLRTFSDLTGIHLTAVKYRYAQHPNNIEWIMSGDYDNRYYEWEGHRYNLSELCLISGIRYGTLASRIKHYGWSLSDAMIP